MEHLFSIFDVDTVSFIFLGNKISMTSLSGPLIYIEGSKDTRDQTIVIAFNSVQYVHAFASTNFVQIVRYFYGLGYDPDVPSTASPPISSVDLSIFQRFMTFSGGVLI